jgi:DNA-binding CsgD family transcriptional regulator
LDKLASAQLQVVLPGTRASFRRRVVDALLHVVPAAGAFCFFGKDDSRAYADSTRVVDGAVRSVLGARGRRLSAAFGFDPASVVATPRRFDECSAPDGLSAALLVFLHEGGVLFGLAGLERRPGQGEFGESDVHAVEALAPFIVASARAQMQYDELSREAAALRTLGNVQGAVFVVDRDRKQVLWAADRQNGIDWDDDVAPSEGQLVEAVERWLSAKKRGEAMPTPPVLPFGTLVAVSRIEDDPVFGGARCAAARVEAFKTGPALEGLSKRERDIARLLVAGYSGVNAAAISGLSENTVRTYVRRLYAKLGVSNRADLVRQLVSPERKLVEPPSSVMVQPDSALEHGDDTLD